MRIEFVERFREDVRGLPAEERSRVLDLLLTLPKALGAPHIHGGLGMRKIHSSGIWEARLGLGLGMVFGVRAGTLTLLCLGSHDEIRRYLKTLDPPPRAPFAHRRSPLPRPGSTEARLRVRPRESHASY